MPPKKRTLSPDEDEKPDLPSDSGSDDHPSDNDDFKSSPSKTKKPRGRSASASASTSTNADRKPGTGKKGRPWTSAEYVELFQRVEEMGKKAAFESFPGRTKNQAYQAWR